MATSGGIVSIIFEADTSKIDKAFSDIEKKASKINLKALNAETRNLNAQTAKLAAQTAKIEAAYKKAHPEIDKSRVSIERLAEKNKVLLEQEKTKQTQIKANAAESIRLAELQTAKEMQQQRRLSADWVRSIKNKFNLEREYRKDELNELKRRYSYETEQSKLAVQQEKDREKALKYEQQVRLALEKAKQAEAAKAAKELEQEEKARERNLQYEQKTRLAIAKAKEKADKDAVREEQSRIKTITHQFYAIKNAANLIAEGFKNINNGIKSALSFTVSWTKAMLTVINPVKVLTFNFLKASGVLSKIKQYLSPRSLIEFGKSAITAASDLTEVQNIVETAFPNMTSQMNEWAENSIDMMGLSQKSAKQYAATLGLMAQSAGLAEKASYKLGTGLTTVTADLASMYNMKAEDVYEKIRSGVIGGRTAAIAQLGINMNQANLQAYMASKGMAEKYGSLDNATKTAIRYNYVLEQTKKIQGDFIKTQGTWANQTRILSESITQLKASLGTFLVSVLTPLLQRLNQLIKLLIVGVDKLKGILNILGIQIQTAASQSSSGISDLTDDLYENAEAADAVNKAAAKLTDGPFSEMHKLSGDDGEGNKLAGIFGGADGLMDLENPYELKTLNTLEEYLNRLKSKLNLGELKIAGIEVLKDIKDWIDGIKKAWKDAWNKDDRGTKYLQSVVDLVTEILKLVDNISDAFLNMWNAGWGERLFGHMLETATLINNTVKDIVKSIREAWNTGSGHYGFVAKTDDEKAYENTGKKAKGSGIGVRQFTSYSMGGFTDTKAMENTDKVYRELTWGEYFAGQFYKANDAVLTFIDSLTKFIAKINENINWEKILEGWANALGKFADTLDRLSQWLEDHPEVAQKIGELITNIASNPDGIFKTIVAINLLKGALTGLPKILMGAFVLKNIGFGSFVGSIGSMITNGLKTVFIKLPQTIGGMLKSTFTNPAFVAVLGIEEFCGAVFGAIDGIFDEKNKDHPWYQKLFIDGPANNRALISGQLSNKIVDILNDVGIGDKFRTWLAEADAEAEDFLQRRNEAYTEFGNWIDQWFGTRETKDKEYNDNLTMLAASSSSAIKIDYEQLGKDIENSFDEAGKAIETFVNNTKSKFDELISKAKELGEKIKEAASQKFNDIKVSINDKVSQARNFMGLAKVRFNANGGAYKPNDPQLRVIGDSSQHEYDLTESHLDNIANRMTGAIINGFMRASSMNTGSKGNVQPIINVQIGTEQIQDLIIRTVEENGYRFS